jgi:hypothetical protein
MENAPGRGWLLKKGWDDADARAVAAVLAKYLANNSNDDANDLIEPLLPIMLSAFATIVWPPLGQAIVQDRTKAWQLEHALGDSPSFGDKNKPPILSVPGDVLFAWCHAHPDVAPAFLAKVVPVLTSRKPDATDRAFHPMMMRVLDEFGEREDVRRAVEANMHTFGWRGSLTTYYALYEQPLALLAEHPIGAVRRWAQLILAQMRKNFASAKMEDDEQSAHWDV